MTHTKPILMGGLMGVMMLWMAHDPLTTGTTPRALFAFVAAHLVAIAVLAAFALFATPKLRARLHRPSAGHVAVMVFAAAAAAGIIHFLHGGPA